MEQELSNLEQPFCHSKKLDQKQGFRFAQAPGINGNSELELQVKNPGRREFLKGALRLGMKGIMVGAALRYLAGCSGNPPGSNPAPSFTTYPSLVHEENTVYTDTIIAAGSPSPTYALVQSPPNMVLDSITGDLSLAAVDSIRGVFPLEIRASNSEGVNQWADVFRIVYNYVNAMTQLDIRGNVDYVPANQFIMFESQPIPEQYPFSVGGGQDVLVDAQIAGLSIPGLFPVIVQYLGRPDKTQDILDLQNAGWEPIVIELHTGYLGVGGLKEDFDTQCINIGFNPPP